MRKGGKLQGRKCRRMKESKGQRKKERLQALQLNLYVLRKYTYCIT
jgi:hypothetical protein